MKNKYRLNKGNCIFILVLTIIYVLGYLFFSPKDAYSSGYFFGSLVFYLLASFIVSFIVWLVSKGNPKSVAKSFNITLSILLIISFLQFISKLGQIN